MTSSDPPPVCQLGPTGLPASFLANLKELQGKLIFVTGGVGFLGGHIVSVLLQAGARVKVFDVVLPREGHSAWKKEDPVEVIKGESDTQSGNGDWTRDGAGYKNVATNLITYFIMCSSQLIIFSLRV